MSDENVEAIKELLEQLVEHRRPEKLNVLERHAQTIMVGLVTVGIVWMSASISSTNADVQVLKAQNAHMTLQIADLKELVKLSRAGFVQRAEFNAHARENERRISVLEKRLEIMP